LPHAPGQQVALHCIAPAQATARSVLFVHGASFPTLLAAGFEFAPGDSWLAFMARRGYLACGLDFIGFGASSRPPAMSDGEAGTPVTRATEAAEQIALAVDHLRHARGMKKVHLVAHSWGTIAAAAYAASHPEALDSLTLFGPVTPLARPQGEPVRKAWWGITAQARYRQLRYADVLPPGMVLLEPAVDSAWAARFEASAPHVAGDPPGLLRIPAGPVADIGQAQAGRYPYAAKDVRVPVFVVYGDHDTVVGDASAAAFLARFTASPLRWRLRIDHGTHVMHLERARRSLYESVEAFIQATEANP
jgi:pimeloyl-ACP methyl ester carboxylesterase